MIILPIIDGPWIQLIYGIPTNNDILTTFSLAKQSIKGNNNIMVVNIMQQDKI